MKNKKTDEKLIVLLIFTFVLVVGTVIGLGTYQSYNKPIGQRYDETVEYFKSKDTGLCFGAVSNHSVVPVPCKDVEKFIKP